MTARLMWDDSDMAGKVLKDLLRLMIVYFLAYSILWIWDDTEMTGRWLEIDMEMTVRWLRYEYEMNV